MRQIFYFILITLAIGVLLGVFTSFGQTIIPEPFKQLANSYSVWLFFSLVAGYLLASLKKAALAGALLQYVAILFYYVASSIRFDMEYSLEDLISLNILWIVGGTLAGPLAGIAGALMRRKNSLLPLAVGFMAGLFISEGLYQFINLKYVGEGVVFVVTALIFLIVSYYKTGFSIIRTVLIAIMLSLIMYIGYAFVLGGLFQYS